MIRPRTSPTVPQKPIEAQVAIATRAWEIETALADEIGLPMATGHNKGRTEKTLLGAQMRLRETVRASGTPDQKKRMREADRLRWELVGQLDRLLDRMCRDDEALQVGREGAFRAALIWEPERGSLNTHAGWWIRASLQRNRPMDILPPTGIEAEQIHHITRLETEAGTAGRALSARELASALEVPLERIHYLKRRRNRTMSGDMMITGMEHGRMRLLDLLETEEDQPLDLQVSDRLDGAQVIRLIDRLPARHQEVLREYFGPDEVSLQDIGARRGLSRERIRQIKQEGLRTLQRLMDDDSGFAALG